ncbi:hypothetical protein EAL2_808p04060 (plasmid) [Peptoclostridium acidaminophilum DSM 3953]|uniref:Uncharacterized protein n=1 Tax=Peptoclostridium acidaminophilum DSM 3953 TaxID=1286171 RepID=W8TAI5_PEPAC|nr:hypothetical protein EAL2_808p04060 [Peptoclostridium acidaminophilum DSM 3953]
MLIFIYIIIFINIVKYKLTGKLFRVTIFKSILFGYIF